MIPHHLQAIDMAKMVGARTRRPGLRTLAEGIQCTQGREIATMQG